MRARRRASNCCWSSRQTPRWFAKVRPRLKSLLPRIIAIALVCCRRELVRGLGYLCSVIAQGCVLVNLSGEESRATRKRQSAEGLRIESVMVIVVVSRPTPLLAVARVACVTSVALNRNVCNPLPRSQEWQIDFQFVISQHKRDDTDQYRADKMSSTINVQTRARADTGRAHSLR